MPFAATLIYLRASMPSNISRNQNQCTKRRLGWWTYLSQSIIFFLDKPWFLLLSVSLECKHVACVVFFCHVSQATMGKKCLVGLAISKFQIYLNMSCWNVWKFMYEDFVPFVFGPIRFFLNKFNIFSLSPEGRSANAKTSSHVLGNGNWSRSRRSNRMRGTKNSPSYLRNLGCFKWLCSPLPLGLLWGNTYRCTETSNKNILPNVRL